MKWKLVPAEQFYELMFSLAELERNGALPYQLEGMAAAIEAAPQPPKLSDERILHHLDAILKASGSSLKNYSMHKTIEDMKQVVRAIEREILGIEQEQSE